MNRNEEAIIVFEHGKLNIKLDSSRERNLKHTGAKGITQASLRLLRQGRWPLTIGLHWG